MKNYMLQVILLLCLSSSCFVSPARAEPFILPPKIAMQLETFKNMPGLAAKNRVLKIEALIAKLKFLTLPNDVASLIDSDLVNTKALDVIKKHSRGVVSLADLKSLPIATGFSLGLSARSGIYEILSERFHLKPWTLAYPEFQIDWHKVKNHTEVFLNRVQATEKPVVFFLPQQTLSYTGTSITVDELKWYLQDEARLKNVYFVFGAYDLITPDLEKAREEAGYSTDEFRALFLRALGATSSSYDDLL
jgi:hypothetical protein